MRCSARRWCWQLLLLVALPAWTYASVIYVNGAATGANNGSSWADAFTSLQAGLAAAGSGDEVWVAAASYRPTTTTDRTLSFALKNGVGVFGGFDGTETMLTERNPAVNVTILSGDIGVQGNATDNSYHVVTVDGSVTATGVLDGFTITAGQADGAGDNTGGAGMWMSGGSPMLANLKFDSNFANTEGGGLRVTGGSPVLTNSQFTSNSVAFGGFGGGLRTAVGLTCRGCVFRGNFIQGAVTGSGGISSSGGLTLVNSVVVQNSPSGMHLTGDGHTLENCTVGYHSAYGVAFIVSNGNSLTNTILWGNGTAGVFADGLSTFSASYCDAQGGALPGTGNISANPLFVAAPGDLRPGPGSPVIDAGNNAAVPGGVTTDVLGLPRFFDDPSVPDTGAGTPPIVDMGAYERVPLTVTDPASLDLCSGEDAMFSVTASGAEPLGYQWRKDSSPLSDGGRISGALTDTLSIDATIPGDSGDYDVVVTDAFGQPVTSGPAQLDVNDIPAQPVITAPPSVAVGSTGNVASVANHAGSTYAWTLTGGTISGGQGSSQITFDAGTPGATMVAGAVESAGACDSTQGTAAIQVDFLDVPPADLFHDFVIAVARNGITAGCGGGNYCRNNPVTRAQMAVFLLKASLGSNHVPPPCTGTVFADVPCTGGIFDPWIEELAGLGITGGCGGGNYCPGNTVTRGQMAVFLLKAFEGSTYDPPDCTGVFQDVPCTPGSGFSDWIEELFDRQITGGCSVSPPLYCPNNPNTRGQMAVFLTKTFNLQ